MSIVNDGARRAVRPPQLHGAAAWGSYITDPGAWIAWIGSKPRVIGLASVFALVMAACLSACEAVYLLELSPTVRSQWGVFALVVWLAHVGLYWALGPACYRLRLLMAGGSCDARMSRLAYFSSAGPAMLWVLSMALILMADGSSGVSPSLALLILLGTMLLLSMGSFHLWIMSWKALGAKKVPSLLLIGMLPVVAYAAQLLAIFGMSAFVAAMERTREARTAARQAEAAHAAASPSQSESQSLEWSTFEATPHAPYSFEYPADWDAETEPVDEGDMFAVVNCLNYEGEEMMLFGMGPRETAAPIATSLNDMVDSLRAGGFALEPTAEPPLRELGAWPGRGRLFVANDQGERVRAIVFIIDANAQQGVEHGRVMVLLVSPDLQPTQLGPRFDRMLSSLRLK